VHTVQEGACPALRAPVSGNAQLASVGQFEAGHVDCGRPRMPTERRIVTTIEVAAGIAADMIDPRDVAAAKARVPPAAAPGDRAAPGSPPGDR